MSKKFTLNQLTEGIRQRHVGTQNRQLIEKWARTGLLRGLDGTTRENMATLLENQAAQVLREQNSLSTGGGDLTSSGDVRGFQNIAFPMVRRVFGGLIANELVSIQPMSLPSGLLFYLDYTYGTDTGDSGVGTASYQKGQSIYNKPPGKGIRSGSQGVGGQYDLAGSGYSRVQKVAAGVTITASGAYAGSGTWSNANRLAATGSDGKLLQFDPQITRMIEDNSGGDGLHRGDAVYEAVLVSFLAASFSKADSTLTKEFVMHKQGGGAGSVYKPLNNGIQGNAGFNVMNIKRLNQLGTWSGNTFTANSLIAAGGTNAHLLMICSGSNIHSTAQDTLDVAYVLSSTLNVGTDGDALTIPAFESDFSATPSPAIPEIDIKIESIAVTAETRKLRARWSPELAQDLNAYHSLDAEVELTQILSEQVALELDREILNDLLQGAKTNYYWSRAPGKFVNKQNGTEIAKTSTSYPGPSFTGTVREWYETLIETVIDVANEIHRLTLRGSANFIVVSPDVATILEASVLYRPQYSIDGEGQVGAPMNLGAEKVGTLSNRFTVYKDPYFPRNKVLVGYKGGSYLETGYVYAPYVPLIVTPTIFAPEDFTPRKGVMTRYGKKMVRNDFYGTVTVQDLNII
jgi:hypothetical protein